MIVKTMVTVGTLVIGATVVTVGTVVNLSPQTVKKNLSSTKKKNPAYMRQRIF